MGEHAFLSPSSASRWLNCTPSARLEEPMQDTAGEAAQEGTLAHRLSELMLLKELNRITKKDYKGYLLDITKNELYSEEMMDYAGDYVSIIMETLNLARQQTLDAIIYPEQKFDLSAYIPEGFGTTDTVIIADRIMYVIDLKYGKGVPVSAEKNKQGMLYALGAYLEFAYAYDIDTIVIMIVQPRIDNNSSYEISVKDLLEWAETELKPLAALAFAGEGEFKPGGHCQFCKARPNCRANHDYQLELAKLDFKEGPLLTDVEITFVLDRIKGFEGWLTSIKEYALFQAVNNNKVWPGYKLVEGRANRKYGDEEKVLLTLASEGYKPDDVGRFKLFGIKEMEKELGIKVFNELLSLLVIKPKGKLKLAPINDKREEFNSIAQAQKDFAADGDL